MKHYKNLNYYIGVNMRKELTIFIETGEEQIEANFRNGHEDGTITIGFESMKFVINVEELEEALAELKKFKED